MRAYRLDILAAIERNPGVEVAGDYLYASAKELALAATGAGGWRYYLFPLAAAGQAGVERALELMRAEIERGMRLMGCTSVNQLGRANLRFR